MSDSAFTSVPTGGSLEAKRRQALHLVSNCVCLSVTPEGIVLFSPGPDVPRRSEAKAGARATLRPLDPVELR